MSTNRFQLASMATDDALTVTNHELKKPILYIGVTAQLDYAIWNYSQADMFLQSGEEASTLSISFPPKYFTQAQLKDMKISVADWSFVNTSSEGSLDLTYTGPDQTPWKAGTSINFSVTNVLTTAPPDAKNAYVNIDNIQNASSLLQATLSLVNKPAGNPKLADILQVSLDNQGVIFVSSRNGEVVDALPNTLMLNIKNSGLAPLYQGANPWKGDPKVCVTFVYGNTSGALAPDKDKETPGLGSAWNIVVSLPVAQAQWGFKNPSHTGQAPDPEWTLFPVPSNKEILGVGDQANVTFAYAPVVSFTPVGHTQMTLVFSGFMQNETTPYEDAVFVLDVNKQNPPSTRGLLSLSSVNPVVKVDQPRQSIDIPLSWGMFDVASIQLLSSYPGSALYTKNYPIDAVPSTYPLGYDHCTISIPAVSQSTPIFFTLQSYDGFGGFLNSLQFTAFLDVTIFVDPRDGIVYPIIQVGTQLWLAANLQYDSGFFYNNDKKYNDPYGRLYTVPQWKVNPPPGWRVPTTDDWKKLVNAFTAKGQGPTPYQALIAGGSSGFNAQLGGYFDPDNVPQFSGLGTRGYYWTSSSKNSDDMFVVVFSSVSSKISVSDSTLPNLNAASVRLVRDI